MFSRYEKHRGKAGTITTFSVFPYKLNQLFSIIGAKMKLPPNGAKERITEARQRTQLSVFKRYYDIMQDYHLDTLTHIEESIRAGASAEDVKQWIREVCRDNDFVDKCYGAARYIIESADS